MDWFKKVNNSTAASIKVLPTITSNSNTYASNYQIYTMISSQPIDTAYCYYSTKIWFVYMKMTFSVYFFTE